MLRVVVYELVGSGRAKTVCDAMTRGIIKCGDNPKRRYADYYRPGNIEADVAVFYGFTPPLRTIMRDYRDNAKAVYIDLGYWGKHEGGRRAGYHKVTINDRHPTKYFQNVKHKSDRFDRFNLKIKPWRQSGDHVLVAGMSYKAANASGFAGQEWELKIIRELKQNTGRKIVYRPKPNCKSSGRINGVDFSPPDQPLAEAMQNCHCIVSHHSNVMVDGLIEGMPGFSWEGAAVPMTLSNLEKVEEPIMPDGREQFMADLAYCQFTVHEMEQGVPWRHFKSEGLIP